MKHETEERGATACPRVLIFAVVAVFSLFIIVGGVGSFLFDGGESILTTFIMLTPINDKSFLMQRKRLLFRLGV